MCEQAPQPRAHTSHCTMCVLLHMRKARCHSPLRHARHSIHMWVCPTGVPCAAKAGNKTTKCARMCMVPARGRTCSPPRLVHPLSSAPGPWHHLCGGGTRSGHLAGAGSCPGHITQGRHDITYQISHMRGMSLEVVPTQFSCECS